MTWNSGLSKQGSRTTWIKLASESILLVGPSWVGDMVMAQSLFKTLKTLKTSDSDPILDVLAPAWSLPIVARMPEVRDGIASQTTHGEVGIGKRREIACELRQKGYSFAALAEVGIDSVLCRDSCTNRLSRRVTLFSDQ